MDKDKLRRKLNVIESERSLLEDYVGLSYEDFVSDLNVDKYYASLHHLQVALQATLDIAQYIVSHQVLGDYKRNKEVFELLKKSNILSPELSSRFAGAVGVRNILVHQYEDVDSERIYDIIQNKLGDFDSFVMEISNYLNSFKD